MPCQPRLVHARNRGVRGSGPPGFRRGPAAMACLAAGPLPWLASPRGATASVLPAGPSAQSGGLDRAPSGGVYATILPRSAKRAVLCTYAVLYAARPPDLVEVDA